MFSDTVKYSQILSTLLKYCQMFQNTANNYQILSNILKHCQQSSNTVNYSQILSNILKHLPNTVCNGLPIAACSIPFLGSEPIWPCLILSDLVRSYHILSMPSLLPPTGSGSAVPTTQPATMVDINMCCRCAHCG